MKMTASATYWLYVVTEATHCGLIKIMIQFLIGH